MLLWCTHCAVSVHACTGLCLPGKICLLVDMGWACTVCSGVFAAAKQLVDCDVFVSLRLVVSERGTAHLCQGTEVCVKDAGAIRH